MSYYKKDKRVMKQKINDVLGSADLITANTSFNWTNRTVQEQDVFPLIINEIVTAIKIQKKGGVFVCRFFETYTRTSIKIIEILNVLYEKVYFVKPLTSRASSAEKYAVCVNFKYDDKNKDLKNIIKTLDTLIDAINKNKNEKIVDIFTNYEIPTLSIHTMMQINKMVSNPQLKIVGEMLTFIDKENYSGDEYHTRKDEQIACSKYWIDLFYRKDISTNKKTYENIVSVLTKKAVNQVKRLGERLVFVQNQ
jgi:hypothetical protein